MNTKRDRWPPPLSQPFFFVARKRRLEKREPAGETSRRVITECTRRSILFFICPRQRGSAFPSAKLVIEVDGSQHYEEKG